MSLALSPVQIQQTLDPRVNLGKTERYLIYRGGSTVTQQPSISTSFSTSTVNFTANPPSPFIIVDPKVFIVYNVRFSFAGTSALGFNLLQIGTADAPRSWPIHRSINTAAISINNTQVSLTVYPVLTIIQQINMQDVVRRQEYSMSPTMPDMFQDYSQGIGAIRNPLGDITDTPVEVARGGFRSMVVNSNTPTSAQVDCVFCEPLLVSPLNYGVQTTRGLYGVQNLSIQLTLQANLSRMWSHSSISGQTFSAGQPVVTFNAPPVALFTYITPNPTVSIPRSIAYPYYVLDYYNSDSASTLAPSASLTSLTTQTLTSSTITLSEMPRSLILAVRQRDADLTVSTSDVFAPITAVTMTVNNQSGILAAATGNDLYRMSQENGLDRTWPEWLFYTGAPLVIVPGKDFGLPPTLASGVGGQFNLQVQATFFNPPGNPAGSIQYSLYVLAVREGIFTLEQNRAVPQLNVITPDDCLKANETPLESYDQRMNKLMYGGNLTGALKSFSAGLRSAAAGAGRSGGAMAGSLSGGVRRMRRRLRGRGFEEDERGAPNSQEMSARELRGGRMISVRDLRS